MKESGAPCVTMAGTSTLRTSCASSWVTLTRSARLTRPTSANQPKVLLVVRCENLFSVDTKLGRALLTCAAVSVQWQPAFPLHRHQAGQRAVFRGRGDSARVSQRALGNARLRRARGGRSVLWSVSASVETCPVPREKCHVATTPVTLRRCLVTIIQMPFEALNTQATVLSSKNTTTQFGSKSVTQLLFVLLAIDLLISSDVLFLCVCPHNFQKSLTFIHFLHLASDVDQAPSQSNLTRRKI